MISKTDDSGNKPFNEYIDGEVLFFIRIKGKKQYFDLYYPESFLSKFSNLSKFATISEYGIDADVLIDIDNINISEITIKDFNIIDEVVNFSEIYSRCRGLRAIHLHEAWELVLKVSHFFINFFSESKVKLIVSGTVDNYVMDLMFRFARHFNVKCIGITDFFLFPDYKLVTKYGENSDFRIPSEEEVEKVVLKLENKEKSPLAISKKKAVLNAIWNGCSFYYRFVFRYFINYQLEGKLGYEYRFAPYLRHFYDPKQLLAFTYFDKITLSQIAKSRSEYIYIPLHWYPEATIDYWTDNYSKANYYQLLFRVLRFFGELGKKVILKEHPAFYFARPISIYKQIKQFPGVILLNPYVSTQDIFDVVDDVVVWNGSTGVEAIMANKNVYITTESYYSGYKLPSYTAYGSSTPLSKEERRELVERILRSTLVV
ncbi:hypothetical protein EGI26_07405 [Lacihabitans sp. CCS-44]|uniref:capsular polysaccharide export protein, LipB/KpsS family n=1 Tax=Lacihabitans sp. CCS-44 TaxID=2487331 RepID=UPI0020CDB159|nr:hypothetical protein [Lacihabitans sp. CCS-44]MCP9754977.1 hypothetical protein [Lacihabitans sp. CCS-44]